ncbi:Slp family lipoprotein [Ectothiorhodospiraceae bacterium WFHF3C12]|nr:Slp family lipoprotein [Ectothiorhodospiraceae bacterium WFHF3C12]
MLSRWLTPCVLLLTLAGCASSPEFDETGVDRSLTPKLAADRGEGVVGERVIWGGTIIDSQNLAEETRLEVLAYPLNSWERPRESGTAQGRFLVLRSGYLETADYAPGRQITVVGPVDALQDGRIGETSYTYPVVRADTLHLWREESAGASSGPRVNFGIGVIFSN